jgi:myo-inositol 2-dehydrogenase / D-chiro-inositol 1-dehydrogenase
MPKRASFNRRQWLRRSAALAAAVAMPTIIPRSALSSPLQPGPNERVTMGFIGCGRQMDAYNIPQFVRTPGVQPLAVCDVDAWRLDNAVRRIQQEYETGKASGTLGTIDKYVDYQDLQPIQDPRPL